MAVNRDFNLFHSTQFKLKLQLRIKSNDTTAI